ncbi:hypothetical protein [Paraburkholderia bryophila]|uniref:Uncharacterized protein n=1 Tax=Paraburkholderia bryophila TaxID=420952 RepID=A0A7Y9WV93_9BURK|nr:hypothetical protein [Paraburkholderia bryophila]NYH27850.1 hypothetical protein [Paraburkholderia bryophila]
MYHDTDLPNPPVPSIDGLAPTREAHGWPAPAVAPPRFGRLAMGVATAGALALGVMGTLAYGVWFNHDQQAYAEAIAGARQALGASAAVRAGGAVGRAGRGTANAATANAATANAATENAAIAAPATAAAPTPTWVAPTAAETSSEAQSEQGGRLASWSGQVARPSMPDPELARATNITNTTDATPTASPSSSSSSSASRRSTAAADSPTQQLIAARPAKDPRSADTRAASPSGRHAANTRPPSLFARMGQFFHRVSYRQHGNASQQDIYSHP